MHQPQRQALRGRPTKARTQLLCAARKLAVGKLLIDETPGPGVAAWRYYGGVDDVSTEIVVRAVRREDFPAWQVLWEGYNAFYGREGNTKLPTEIVQMTWSRFFDSYEPVHAVVAERAGVLLGLAHFLFHRSTTHIGPLCYLQDLFTAESARGHGVGRALIGAVYERAAAAGSSRVYWMTHETNSAAMALYDKVAENSGFIVYRHLL